VGRSRLLAPLIVMTLLAALCVGVIALPASVAGRFLPQSIVAQDFSGTLWHGSAGSVSVDARNAGAVEWRLHPASLLMLGVAADLHWVKTGFVADAAVEADSHGVTMRNLTGGGPIEDLHELGLAEGWRGVASFKFSELSMAFGRSAAGTDAVTLKSAVGDLNLSNLATPRLAGGGDLGGYALHAADAAITPGGDASAEITDTGGPLEVQATVHLSADLHTGMLSGTVRPRADAAPALRAELDNLAQLHAHDAEGWIPVDLEFTL
jgi:hypothetical protein